MKVFPLRFGHFTTNIDSLLNIASIGLFVRANKRLVVSYLTDRPEFRGREPQEFGMTSVHAFRLRPSRRHLCRFGRFGIEFTPEWIARERFRPVIYIGRRGRLHERVRLMFDRGIRELDEILARKDGGYQMAYTNKSVAGLLQAEKWVEFLEFYQLVEPRENAFQTEWRYSREEPYYARHTIEELKEITAEEGLRRFIGRLALLPFDVDDVAGFYVPRSAQREFRDRMPPIYLAKPVMRS